MRVSLFADDADRFGIHRIPQASDEEGNAPVTDGRTSRRIAEEDPILVPFGAHGKEVGVETGEVVGRIPINFGEQRRRQGKGTHEYLGRVGKKRKDTTLLKRISTPLVKVHLLTKWDLGCEYKSLNMSDSDPGLR